MWMQSEGEALLKLFYGGRTPPNMHLSPAARWVIVGAAQQR